MKPLTLPGATRLSMPTKSRCSSVSLCRFSSWIRLCWSVEVTSVMAWRASVWRGPSLQAGAGGLRVGTKPSPDQLVTF